MGVTVGVGVAVVLGVGVTVAVGVGVAVGVTVGVGAGQKYFQMPLIFLKIPRGNCWPGTG